MAVAAATDPSSPSFLSILSFLDFECDVSEAIYLSSEFLERCIAALSSRSGASLHACTLQSRFPHSIVVRCIRFASLIVGEVADSIRF